MILNGDLQNKLVKTAINSLPTRHEFFLFALVSMADDGGGVFDLNWQIADKLPGRSMASNRIREAIWDLESKGLLEKLSKVVGIDHEEGYKVTLSGLYKLNLVIFDPFYHFPPNYSEERIRGMVLEALEDALEDGRLDAEKRDNFIKSIMTCITEDNDPRTLRAKDIRAIVKSYLVWLDTYIENQEAPDAVAS